MLFSFLIYGFYLLLVLLIPLLYSKKSLKKYVLLVLIFTAQFNVTSLFKLGVTFTFFELALLLSALFSIKVMLQRKEYKILLVRTDRIYFYFLLFSFISILVALGRLITENLSWSSEYPVFPMFRSIMSLNKPIFYLLIFIVRQDFIETISLDQYRRYFIKYLALSGILPAIAVFLQFLAIGFIVIHNNPSYAEYVPRIVAYNGERVVGLSNEAAGHCYELFFAYVGLVHGFCFKLFSKKTFFLLAGLYLGSVILTISRTGLLVFFLYSVYKYLLYKKTSFKTVLKLSLFGAVGLWGLTFLNINGFNLYERLLTVSNVQADLSTIERYGLTQALFDLAWDRSLGLGVGIYNYFYYLKDYLPDYVTTNISYTYGVPLPSFNFILQLWAEYGLVLCIIFFWLLLRIIRICKDALVKEWFLFLFIFALSFQILNFSIPFLIFFYIPLYSVKPEFLSAVNHKLSLCV